MASETDPLKRAPALHSLAPGLQPLLLDWLADLARAIAVPEPGGLLEELDCMVWGTSSLVRTTPQDALTEIREWLDAVVDAELLALMALMLERCNRYKPIPRATPDQIRIIQESQEEVGVFWTEMQLRDMTRWQADTVIKGLMVRSEVRRATGAYDYPIRSLRQAVRQDLGDMPVDDRRRSFRPKPREEEETPC
jgi:hypothetical protein